MAEYHVGCGAFAIYAGTLNAKNKNLWQNKTDCTDEAINAVRDYMVQELLGGFDCMKAKTSDGVVIYTHMVKHLILIRRQTKMKLFGDPKLKQKADKLASVAVLMLAATCTAIGAIWLLGAAFHVVFSWMGVA